MANRHTKMQSASSTGKCESESQWEHSTFTRVAKYKRLILQKCYQAVEQMDPASYITGKSMNTITLYSLLKLQTHTHTHTHAKLFLVISLKEMCKRIPEVIHKYVHNNMNQKTSQDSRENKLLGML